MRPLSSFLATGLVLLCAAVAPAQYGDLGDLEIKKPEDKVDFKSTPAPEGAIVLFDGKSLDGWLKQNGKEKAAWKLVEGGAMQVNGGNIITEKTFGGHFRLHVEFRVPFMPTAKGQGRGNSGVYLQGRYEVQVLDSYGLESKKDDCGAIYGVSAPLVNACKAPTIWQAYDIDYTAPKFEDGKKTEPAHVTVFQNGVKIQDDVKIPVNNTAAGNSDDPSKPGPIMLQDHGNPVQYRNIWIVQGKD
jgi:hypothetical protein